MRANRSIRIDVLRTIAIISVIIAHTYEVTIFGGGVQLFFFISGYFLVCILEEMRFKSFILYRAARLFPLAMFMTLIFHFRFDSKLEMLSNFLLITAFIPQFTWFPGGWSINYEWIFSFVIFFLFKLKFYISNRLFMLILFSITIVSEKMINIMLVNGDSFEAEILYITFLANIIFIYLGVAVRWDVIKLEYRNVYFLIPILLVLIIWNPFPATFITIWFLSVYILASLAFNLILPLNLSTSKLVPLVTFLGKRTYGLFCGHFIVMILIQKLGPGNVSFVEFLTDIFGVFFAKSVYFFLTLLFSSGFAYISYKYVESPQIRYVRKLIASKNW
jgi:peptidoglycan/LPS O-acetylase OafA/YrhL